MKLKLPALYEPLIIEIGNETVNAAIDVTANNLVRISKVCTDAEKEMKSVATILETAEKEQDFKTLQKMNKKAAEIIEPAIVAAIGQEDYDNILKACGAGRQVNKAACNVVMTQVLTAIKEAVDGQRASVMKQKAAHYLAEVEHAQTKPDASK